MRMRMRMRPSLREGEGGGRRSSPPPPPGGEMLPPSLRFHVPNGPQSPSARFGRSSHRRNDRPTLRPRRRTRSQRRRNSEEGEEKHEGVGTFRRRTVRPHLPFEQFRYSGRYAQRHRERGISARRRAQSQLRSELRVAVQIRRRFFDPPRWGGRTNHGDCRPEGYREGGRIDALVRRSGPYHGRSEGEAGNDARLCVPMPAMHGWMHGVFAC
mmetsp:Transcript_51304/g.154169  ORF Transcript_51304/g.154169 Transcript_51304/m.154169 type:complete len:212 (-) Transcript_51304:728-1363(-)